MNSDPRLGLPSASKLERVYRCAGSHALEQKVAADKPEQEEEPDELRDSGIRIHRARETGNTLELSAKEHDTYQSSLAYEAKLLEKWKETWGFRDDEVVEGPRELRLYLHNHNLDPVGSGQLDVHYIARKEFAICIDWKTGFCTNLIGATGNYQLRMQAVLLWLEHPELKNIRVAFAKPLFDKAHLDYCDYSEQDLKFSHDSIILALWWATQADAQRVPGQHCRYCNAKAHCPESLAYSLLPSVIVKGVLEGKKPAEAVTEVALEDLGRVWEAGATIRKILDEVSDRLKGLDDATLEKVGITHGKGRELLEWTNPHGVFQFLTEKEMWSDKEVWGAFEPVLGRLAALQAKYSGLPEKECPKVVKEALRAFWEAKASSPILKRIK